MITQYFDINQRLVIQAPGTLAPATLQPWVYGDNYNLAIYLIGNGQTQPINSNDSLGLILFQSGGSLPETNLAIISTPVIQTDVSGANYYQINVNLKTTGLANIVQASNQPVKLQFHYSFTPGSGERFSSSADLNITVNPDPLEGSSGATPVPPSYPANPNVFELIANKGVANGYAQLDSTGKVPIAELPTVTGGDMTKAVYDTNNNGVVDTCDSVQSSRVIGLGTAASLNVPASGNATSGQIVLGSDTRLSDSRNPLAHESTHLVGGADPINLATTAGAGLCPPPDGTTIQIVSGKLTATTTGSGDMLKSVYDTNNDGIVDNAAAVSTHIVPPSGNATGTQIVLASDTRLSDSRNPLAHAATHNGGSDPIALASATVAGLCPAVDNVTIQVSASKLAAILATASAPGIVRPDNSSILISGGIISAAAAPIGAHGCRLWNSASQTQGNSAGLSFDTNSGTGLFDTDSYHAAGNPTRITIPASQAGYYLVSACLLWPVQTSGTYRTLYLPVNGNLNYIIAETSLPYVAANSNNGGNWMMVSGIYKFNANDYVELFAVSDQTGQSIGSLGGVTNRYSPVFSAFRIG